MSSKITSKKSSHKKACDLMAKDIAALNVNSDTNYSECLQFGFYTFLFSIFFFFLYRVKEYVFAGYDTEKEKKIRMSFPTAIGATIAPALICAYMYLFYGER
jgi:hypothetical protein